MWILIIFVMASGGRTTAIEFTNQQNCLNAKEQVLKMTKDDSLVGNIGAAVCVQK